MRTLLMLEKKIFIFLTFSFCFTVSSFAQNTRDSLLAVIETAREDTHKLSLLIQLHNHLIDGDQQKARENAEMVLALGNKLDDIRGKFKGHFFLASYYSYQSENEKADSIVDIAIQMAEDKNNLIWQAEAWHQKGNVHGSGWGKSDSARIYYAKSQQFYQRADKGYDAAFLQAKVGMMLHVSGKYDEALQTLQESLTNLKPYKKTGAIAMVLNSIANVHSQLQNHELAKQYYEEALPYSRGKKPFTEAVISFNLGLTISNLEKPEEGFPYLQKAYQIFDSLGDPGAAASSLGMIGGIFNKMNELDSAIHYYEEGVIIQEKLDLKENLAINLLNLGNAWLKKGNLQEAEKHLLRVLNMEDVALQNQTLLLVYQNLGDTYKQLGKYEEATNYLVKTIALKDSTMGDQIKAQIAQNEVEFQTQLKKAEIERQQLVIRQQESRENYLIGISALVLLLLTGIFFFYRNRQRAITREEKLRAKVKEAEAESLREIDRMKSRFFANISHEFRTPLTLILGPVNQLLKKDTIQKDELDKPLNFIQRNASRLLELVNQLMDLSKLESGSMDLKLSRGDIITFVKGIVFSFESLADIKQIHYHTYFPNKSIHTAFDKDKLEKVLTNLIGNAFKFTPEEGDISVEINLQKNPPSNRPTIQQFNHSTIQPLNHLSITIRDNGTGIPEDQLEHIFDRFYQVEANEVQGAGIGLALTKELIELQQGEISVSSIEGQGSTFIVLLPLFEEQQAEVIPVEEQKIPQSAHPSHDSSDQPTLLLVEDNADVRLFIADQLKDKYQLIEAENGKQGLKLACQHIPDLIISDVMMPEMDGNALVSKLKTDERTSHIPVVMLTAKASRESKLEGLETGADDYLTKPFDGEELLVRIKNLIEQRRKLRERFKQDITLQPKDIAITSADERFLNKIIGLVESRLDDEMLSIEEIADAVALSRSQLHRKVKALTDQSPSVFVRSFRLKRAKDLLEQQAGGVAEIAYMTGFSSPTYFSRSFKEQFGMTPGEVKEFKR